ncbi:MAG TPA: succinate dehydrogenase [Polyangiaceae bacterium]
MTSLSREHQPTPTGKEPATVWLRRLHSVSGVLPLGAFLVLHLWVNARAMQGELRYDAVVRKIQSIPGLVVLEVCGLGLPLLFHAGYGIWTMRRPSSEVRRSSYEAPWAAALQRAAGLVTLAFLAVHVATLRLRVALGTLGPSDLYSTLTDSIGATTSLGLPFLAVFYLVGLGGASYHLATGLVGFSLTWGLAPTERAHRLWRLGSSAVGLALFLLGARTIVYFATGAVPSFGVRTP